MSSDNLIGSRFSTAVSNGKPTLDDAVKRVLALKPILARILQGCVEEFSDLPISDIENKYIEGTPSIATEAVHEDESLPVITGSNTEHKTVKEGTVTFDLKFNAVVPNNQGYMQLIINVEGQNKAKYPIPKRGLYYCGRMLSAQYGTVFHKSHYEKLRKVISIWICFVGNRKQLNTINRYRVQETPIYGNYKANVDHYNMLEVVTLYIGDDMKTDNMLLKMLDKIFTKKYNVSEKKKFLQDECGIIMTEAEEAEVDNMCNYSDYVEERGKKTGIAIGNKERLLQDVRNLMKNLNMTAEKAMQALSISPEEQAELLAEL